MKFKINNEEWEIRKVSNAEMNVMVPSDKRESFTHGSTQYDELVIYLNEDAKSIRRTLIHELMHCFMYEFGHNQWEKEYNNEDVCEIIASSYDMINKIVEEYFRDWD